MNLKANLKIKITSSLLSVILVLTMISMPVFSLAETGSDIANHWAKDQIEDLIQKGIVNGYKDGSIRPDNPITRAEFMSVINNAFGFTDTNDSNKYKDVPENAWYRNEIQKAAAAGYISGYPDGTIKPNNLISRQEAAVIISKIGKFESNNIAADLYKDSKNMPSWSKGFIGAVTSAKVMTGYKDGTFKPGANITRAEAMVTIANAIKLNKTAYDKAGTYGPEKGTETLTGNVVVSADGVTIRNTVIEGNLLVSKEVKEGTATLQNVTVKGNTSIQGGGENSVIIIDSTLGKVTVSKENGKIRILVSGSTTISQVIGKSSIKLEEKNLTGQGFKEVIIDADNNDIITLIGNFEKVQVQTEGIKIQVPSGTVVGTLVADSKAAITGQGTIQVAEINVNGVTFEKAPAKMQLGIGVTQAAAKTPSTGGGSHRNYCDTVLKNGYIYTVDLSGNATTAQAVAIGGGKITYVGTDEGVKRYIGSGTEVIDLGGKMVLPGLSDSHIHTAMTAEMLYNLSLYGYESTYPTPAELTEEYQELTREYIAENPEEPIIRGTGWNPQTYISDPSLIPTAGALDVICSDKPIVYRSNCHHYVWANSKAMELAGITKDTPEPKKGVIWRDAEGNPIGIFQETTAIDLLLNHIPGYDYTVEQYKDAIKYYQSTYANNFGVTLAFDALATENAYTAYKELAGSGKLTMRVRGCYYADPSLGPEQFDTFIARKGTDSVNDLFQRNTVKMFADGSGQSFYLNEPFVDGAIEAYGIKDSDGNFDYSYRGYPQWDDNTYPDEKINLDQIISKLQNAGFQIHIHSMGDGGSTQFLDAFEKIDKQILTENRNVIAHTMLIKEQDIQRMGKLNIMAAPQPYWFTYDTWVPYYYGLLFGYDRIQNLYPMKSFLDNGVRVASGSDFPVTIPPNPMYGIQLGMTRTVPDDMPDYQNPDYHRPLGPDTDQTKECVTLQDMIQSFTINGAYENFLENTTGSIEPGKSADLVVLNQNLTAIEPTNIKNTKVLMTFFKGDLVYQP